MFAHLTERGIELEPTNHTERYAVNAYMLAHPEHKVFILGDQTIPKTPKSEVAPAVEEKKNEREIIIAELEANGIAYDKKAGTKTLRGLLVNAAKNVTKEDIAAAAKEVVVETVKEIAKSAPPVVAEDISMFDEPARPEAKATKLPSKEEFREIVKTYAFETSTEKAMKLLKTLGNYTSVSQIPEDKYAEALTLMGKTYGQ